MFHLISCHGAHLIITSYHGHVQVCRATGVDPSDIQYVEAHGTGTVVGDSQELSAIDGLYGAGAGHTAEEPLLIGSVKSNMGHCEGCSGLAGASPFSHLCSDRLRLTWLGRMCKCTYQPGCNSLDACRGLRTGCCVYQHACTDSLVTISAMSCHAGHLCMHLVYLTYSLDA